MNKKEHIARHEFLHRALDELVADFIMHTNGLPSKSTLLDLMSWSCLQTKTPTANETRSAGLHPTTGQGMPAGEVGK